MKSKTSLPVSYRLAVTSRVLAAVIGGYLMASLAAICLALWLPTSRADAVVTGMMSSFVLELTQLYAYDDPDHWSLRTL